MPNDRIIKPSTLAAYGHRDFGTWAREELYIPDGPFSGLPYSDTAQPVHRLLHNEYRNPAWRRYAVVACTQSGKSLQAFVGPIMYWLFERHETVVAAVPQQDMAHDKWAIDIEPAIKASRYRDMIPTSGPGSRGGRFTGVRFRNGAMLRFMSARGGDKAKAGFTAKILAATEVDGYDESGKVSREGDPVSQLEGRLLAYGERARTYLECTVSIEEGRIWQEYQTSSCGVIHVKCPHCNQYGVLEREHLQGWQTAENEIQAAGEAHFVCPVCTARWSEQDRHSAVLNALLVHRGQSVEGGAVVGQLPDTFTCGLRWTAAHNMFYTAGFIGAQEWKARQAADKDNAEKTMCQQFWATPPPPPKLIEESLTIEIVESRANASTPRNVIPEHLDILSAGIDVGKDKLHVTVMSGNRESQLHIPLYTTFKTEAREKAEEVAIVECCKRINDMFRNGFVVKGTGEILTPRRVCIDSGYNAHLVYRIAALMKWIPTKGYGAGQMSGTKYHAPIKAGGSVILVGENYHAVKLQNGTRLLHFNADAVKTALHKRLITPPDQPGALTIYGNAEDHKAFAQHLTAEQLVMENGKEVWRKQRDANHWLDSTVLALLALWTEGVPTYPPTTDRNTTGATLQKKVSGVMRPSVPTIKSVRTKY